MKKIWRSASAEETRALGRLISTQLKPDSVLLLRGELGCGKTVLAQGVAEGLGIQSNQVQSPSFTIVREHTGAGIKLTHIDLYRLDLEEVEEIGIWEILESPGVKIVEWAERLSLSVKEAVEIEIRSGDGPLDRIVTLVGPSTSSEPTILDAEAPSSGIGGKQYEDQ